MIKHQQMNQKAHASPVSHAELIHTTL